MSAMLHVRIDEKTKADALAALDAIGLTASDAVRLLFRRIIADQAFPLELKVPNAETVAAMKEAEETMADHRKRWALEDGEAIDGIGTRDGVPKPGGMNAQTIAAMRKSRAIMAKRRRRKSEEATPVGLETPDQR